MIQAGFLETRRFSPGSLAMAAAIEFTVIAGAVAWQIDATVPSKSKPTTIVDIENIEDPPPIRDTPEARIPPKQPDIYKPQAEVEVPAGETDFADTIETKPWILESIGTGPIIPDPPLDLRTILEPARAKGDVRSLITSADYPESARRREETGTVRARLDIGANGKVTGCTIIASSGSTTLDSATCRLLSSRARFAPAKDRNGELVSDSYLTPKIVWTIAREG